MSSINARQTAYVTMVCECVRRHRRDCPRRCATGRYVLKMIPPTYSRTYAAIDPKPVLAHPEPEVLARPALAREIPRGAHMLVQLLIGAKLPYAVTYAKGSPVHGVTGRALAPRESILVRFALPDGSRVGAQWVDGASDMRKVRYPDGRVADLSDAALRELLRSVLQ